MAIKIVKKYSLPAELRGKVTGVEEITGKFGPQLEIGIKSARDGESYKTYVNLPKNKLSNEVIEGSTLAYWIEKLNKFGFIADSIPDLFLQMEGKSFLFKRKLIGSSDSEKLVVEEMGE